jgi:hypothetical protein
MDQMLQRDHTVLLEAAEVAQRQRQLVGMGLPVTA